MIDSNESINIKSFLTDYKISGIFHGKFFIKRLINKIFKYKINQNLKWNSFFWNNITITKKSTTFITAPSLLLPQNFYSLSEERQNIIIENIIYENTSKRRFRDIKKYQRYINDNIDLGCPLFITGNCFNFLGGNIDSEKIYILDGSRRLVANILNKVNPDILLIDIKE